MDIDLRQDIKGTTQYLTKLQRQVIPKATNRAINTTVRNVKTATARRISRLSGLKVGDINRSFYIQKSRFRNPHAIIVARGRAVTLRRFVSPAKRVPGAFRKKAGVSANPWRKRRTFPGSFIIKGKNHGQALVAIRQGKARYPMKVLQGPSMRREFNRPIMRRYMMLLARKRFGLNFERDLNYYLSRLN